MNRRTASGGKRIAALSFNEL